MSDSVLDICGLGNIVKGVKKRKKKFSSPAGQRTCTCPNADRWRSNESLHTLLSKLDIVEKKLGKFDQNHPLATQEQSVKGSRVAACQNNPCSKLKVRLPDNWLNLMKDYETSGNRPCLEVSVKSEIDYKCGEEQKGIIRGGAPDQSTSRNQMVRRNNSETGRQEFGTLTRQHNNCLGDFGIVKQYSSAENSGPCGESPGIISSSERHLHSKSARPLWTTPLPSSNNLQVIPGAREARTCMEAASVMPTFGTPIDPSVFNTPLCSSPNALPNRQPATVMELKDGENVEFMGYVTSNSGIPYEPKRGPRVCFDSECLPNQKSLCTNGCCSSRTLGYSPRAPKCGGQQLSCPSCGVAPPCYQEVSEPNISCKPGCSPSPSSLCGDQQSSCRSCRAAPTPFCQDGFEQNALYAPGHGPTSSSSCVDQPTSYCQDDCVQNMSYGSRYGPYPSNLYVSRRRDQQLACSCCRTQTGALSSSTRKERNPCKPCSSPRNTRRVPEKCNTTSAFPDCLCAQAICMIQNCSKHKDQPDPKSCQTFSDESCHERSSVCCSCESQFKTLIVNIPRTPIVTSSPADFDSDVEKRNYALQRSDRDESGRIAPIKSCECDIKDQSRISPQKPDCELKGTNKSSISRNEQGRLEQCSLSPSKDTSSHPHEKIDSINDAASNASRTSKSSQKQDHPHAENNSTNDAAPDKNDAAPDKKRVSHSRNSSPEKQDQPHNENSTNDASPDPQKKSSHEKQDHGIPNENSTSDATPDKRGSSARRSRLSKDSQKKSSHEKQDHGIPNENSTSDATRDKRGSSARGSRLSKDSQKKSSPEKRDPGTRNNENKTNYSAFPKQKANPSPHGLTDDSLYIKNGIEFEGKGESCLNPPGNNQFDRKSGRAHASLIIASPPARRGFLPMPHPPRAAPAESELTAHVECDAFSCSTRLPKTRAKQDLFISEGTVLTSHPSSVAINQEYNGVYGSEPKVASPLRSSLFKARMVEKSILSSAESSISTSHQSNNSKSHNTIILPVHLPCCPVPSQLGTKKSSSLNEKYLKELMLPFMHQGAELTEQKDPDLQKNVRNFLVGRLIHVNPCDNKIAKKCQVAELVKVKNEVVVPKKTRPHTVSLELFFSSKPEIPLRTSTCQTEIHERSTCKTVIHGKATCHPEISGKCLCQPGNSGTSACNTSSSGKRTDQSEMSKTSTSHTDRSRKCVCLPEISGTSTSQTETSREYSYQTEMPTSSTSQSGHCSMSTCKHQMTLQSTFQPDIAGTSSAQPQISETSSCQPEISGTSTCQTGISALCPCQPEISMTSTSKPVISGASTNQPQISLQSYQPDISGTSCLPETSRASTYQPELFGTSPCQTGISLKSGRQPNISESNGLPVISETTSIPNEIAPSTSAGKEQLSDGHAREYEKFKEFLMDTIVKLFHSPLHSVAPRLRDSVKQGFQNQDSTMIFNEGTKSMAPPKPCHTAFSPTEKHNLNNGHSSSELLSHVEHSHCNETMNDELKELIWNSHFNPSDTQESNETVYVPTADSQLVTAHVNSDANSDRNIIPQKSCTGLQKASEIMDLLEIFPGQHRQENPRKERTQNWIEKMHKELYDVKDDSVYGKNIKAKAKKSRKRDFCCQKNSKARFFKKGWAIAKLGRNKNYAPVHAVQSSSSVTPYDSSDESEERNVGEQRYLVFMNESSLLSKERCKHGISNRLPKLPTHWFRGTDRDGYSIIQRIGNDSSSYNRPFIIEREPFKKQTHRPHHHHQHHKQRGSSDDSLRPKRKNNKNKELIVRTPKREAVGRQHRDVRVPSRSLSDCSSSNCSVHKKQQFFKARHSNGNDKRHARDHDHKHSLDESHYDEKYEDRSSKIKRMSVYEPKPKNEQPLKSALKKSNLRSVSSTTLHESVSSSSASSSCSSEACRRDKNHRFHNFPVKHPTTHAARHLKVTHSPLPIRRIKVKKKVPNTFHNFRQRLITPDSKSSANFEKVNVKDFIDFLATLSRNTISTLTNKKKALKLYRNYLSSPKRR